MNERTVIMLTAKTSEDNVIQGLDVGADDYLTKPAAVTTGRTPCCR